MHPDFCLPVHKDQICWRTLSIRQIGVCLADRFIPTGVVFAVGRVAVQFKQSRADKRCKKCSCIKQSPFQCFHRIFPPNSVPPSSRFNTSRTAKRPNTKPTAIMTASKMIRFEVIVIKTSLTFWWDECIIKTVLSQSSQPK